LKRRLPRTILIVVSHRQGALAVADQCLHIENGQAATVAGTPKGGGRCTPALRGARWSSK
jgi:ABC-type uncharacterized transport system fused permease/ATPase subunit